MRRRVILAAVGALVRLSLRHGSCYANLFSLFTNVLEVPCAEPKPRPTCPLDSCRSSLPGARFASMWGPLGTKGSCSVPFQGDLGTSNLKPLSPKNLETPVKKTPKTRKGTQGTQRLHRPQKQCLNTPKPYRPNPLPNCLPKTKSEPSSKPETINPKQNSNNSESSPGRAGSCGGRDKVQLRGGLPCVAAFWLSGLVSF